MKLKLLLFFTILSSMLFAQEANRSLVITEARIDWYNGYLEFTNMGDAPLNLGEYKFGYLTASFNLADVWDNTLWAGGLLVPFPERSLEPGESFVVTSGFDFGPKAYNAGIAGFENAERQTQVDIYSVADLILHYEESNSAKYPNLTDSITPNIPFKLWYNWGNQTYYVQHNFAEGDSAVVDQVNGIAGRNYSVRDGFPVAGVDEVTRHGFMVRKFSVKTGNNEFIAGTGLGDSEWIGFRYPEGYDNWRDIPWTVGTHANAVVDANTLEPTSDDFEVDFANKTITVPWGTGRQDDIMRHMVKKPGIYWVYDYNTNRADSVYRSARNGDKLTINACGNTLTQATFDIIVNEPKEDVNVVVPINHKNLVLPNAESSGPIAGGTQAGILGWPRVTMHDDGNDTITGTWHGVPNALRADSLMKYLEIPANASSEFVWSDGVARPDLKTGDKLKVIAQNGDSKEYFIQVQGYSPSHNASLSAITWPDIPEYYKGIFGWTGDTIPQFSPGANNYRVEVPFDVEGVPALVAKKQDVNAKMEVTRVTSLAGTAEDRTVSFKLTAEDDSVTSTYKVELYKQKDVSKQQPYYGEPFISEYIQWAQNSNVYMEVANPGNQYLDLSNYMIVGAGSSAPNPAEAIQSGMNPDNWLNRYTKYVPGYKWVDSLTWTVSPGILEPDLAVDAQVAPGDVFAMGQIHSDYRIYSSADEFWPDWINNTLDVQFNNYEGNGTYANPWNENISGYGTFMRVNPRKAQFYIFKILNDSIKQGLKPANDPNDFELLDVWGLADGSEWSLLVTGEETSWQENSWIRKPEIYKGNTEYGGSFSTGPNGSEWLLRNSAYWKTQGSSNSNLAVTSNLGQHYMNEATHYKSTVTSVVYKVSDGYSMSEDIRGVTTGTTVGAFFEDLNKANEGQSLTVKSTADGSVLELTDILTLNDTLVVLAADSIYTTKYIINVSEEGLSSDAILTSNMYGIEIETQPGSVNSEDVSDGSGIITGFGYETLLKTLVDNIDVPFGATMTVIDAEDAYVPFTYLNNDTAYIDVMANASTYLEVVAENGVTTIVYQLQPTTSENDAFVESYVYGVSQTENLISYVPSSITAQTFLSFIIPSMNATIKLIDKMGNERTEGTIAADDKLIVTSPDGLVTRAYHIAILPNMYQPTTTYLAYVLSDVFYVDQVDYSISGGTVDLTGTTLLADFYSSITASMGATAVIVDAEGNEKTSGGDLNGGDRLKVTSADGFIEVMYDLNIDLTSVDQKGLQQIEIYPNPTSSKLNISGVQAGNRIQIYSSTGALIRDTQAQNSIEVLSLDNVPSGMFLIVISNDNKMLGRYKAIKK